MKSKHIQIDALLPAIPPDPFAEFFNADGSRVVLTEEQALALRKRPPQEPFPAHWELFDSPDIKRIKE